MGYLIYLTEQQTACPAPRQAVAVRDLRTLNPVALTAQVKDFGSGVWFVLECDRPIRVEIHDTFSGGLLSALAFD